MSIHIDLHGEELMRQYHDRLPVYRRMEEVIVPLLKKRLEEQGLYINSMEHRIKEEKSLMKKIELKGAKYDSLSDITDIFGLRVITFYSDDVDKTAAIVKSIFKVDWNDSIDKRVHQLTSFGYNSLHLVCRIPKELFFDPEMPQLNEYRFEIQMRSALQHVWSTIEHDTGYKTWVKIPPEYRRQFSRLAGMLELIDDEFNRLRSELTEYYRQMRHLVASGQLSEVILERETFLSYLKTRPFEKLNQRIAASNQAEIYPAPLLPYLPILESFNMTTLGDVQQMINDNEEDAYHLALSELALTDIDIISENIGLQNLCIVYSLKKGEGLYGIKHIFDILNGERPGNEALAELTLAQANTLPFMHRSES